MDPTLNALAYKQRFEMLAEEARDQATEPEREMTLFQRLGNVLVMAGGRLQESGAQGRAISNERGCRALDCDMCV